jgi:hypothetical protein
MEPIAWSAIAYAHCIKRTRRSDGRTNDDRINTDEPNEQVNNGGTEIISPAHGPHTLG